MTTTAAHAKRMSHVPKDADENPAFDACHDVRAGEDVVCIQVPGGIQLWLDIDAAQEFALEILRAVNRARDVRDGNAD